MRSRPLPILFILPGLCIGLFVAACSSVFKGYYTDYRVRQGDTIARIAERYGVKPNAIVRENGLAPGAKVKAGQELKIPLRTRREQKEDALETRSGSRMNVGNARKYMGNMEWPVPSTHITSSFGRRNGTFHDGVDIRGEYGTEIRAAHSGIVLFSGTRLSGYGNLIAIKGDDGLLTMYGHNQKNYVKRGDRVTRGDCIGEVGSSGRADGPHLHFEVRLKNAEGKYIAVDPLAFFG